MNFSAGVLAFCALYKIACTPDAVATTAMQHLGAPFDQVTWCCGTEYILGEKPKSWEIEKPHTMLCDESVHMTVWTQTPHGTDFSKDPWRDGIGSIYMGHQFNPDYENYCAIWLHRGAVPIS